MIGRVISQKYIIKEIIGQGGTSTIYRAYCKKTGEDVAIKMLGDKQSENVHFVRAFKKEVQASLKLNHENIVFARDVCDADGKICLVMDYVKGQTLKEKINAQGALEIEEVVRIGTEILKGLRHAHIKGFVHRDLKPQNVLIDEEGRARITDFGVVHDTTQSDNIKEPVLGSVYYFSPEQAKAQPVDRRSDIYSLGVVLYEMATGKLPFEGQDSLNVALQHVHAQPVEPIELNEKLPQSLNKIIMKAMSKNKADRYRTSQQMLMDMEKCLEMSDGEYIQQPKKEDKINGMRRVKMAGIFAFVVIFVGVVIFVFNGIISSNSNTQTVFMPALIDRPYDEALVSLDELNMQVDVKYEYDAEVASDMVISQEPQTGTQMQVGSHVKLIVSLGRESSVMPNLKGKTLVEAESILTELNITNITKKYSNDDKPNRVISQTPKAGENVPKAGEVVLNVSGKDEQNIITPGVKGLSLEKAYQKIISAGFANVFVYFSNDHGDKENTVYEQMPTKSVSAQRQSSITLWIQSSKKSNYFSKIPVDSLPLIDGASLQITCQDEDLDIEYIVFDAKITTAEEFTKTWGKDIEVEIYKKQRITTQTVNVYVNGELAGRKKYNFEKK